MKDETKELIRKCEVAYHRELDNWERQINSTYMSNNTSFRNKLLNHPPVSLIEFLKDLDVIHFRESKAFRVALDSYSPKSKYDDSEEYRFYARQNGVVGRTNAKGDFLPLNRIGDDYLPLPNGLTSEELDTGDGRLEIIADNIRTTKTSESSEVVATN